MKIYEVPESLFGWRSRRIVNDLETFISALADHVPLEEGVVFRAGGEYYEVFFGCGGPMCRVYPRTEAAVRLLLEDEP